jgi:hypothetical protein
MKNDSSQSSELLFRFDVRNRQPASRLASPGPATAMAPLPGLYGTPATFLLACRDDWHAVMTGMP